MTATSKVINDLIRSAGARNRVAAPEYDPGAVASKRQDLTERLAEIDEQGLADVDAAMSKVERRATRRGVNSQIREIVRRKERRP